MSKYDQDVHEHGDGHLDGHGCDDFDVWLGNQGGWKSTIPCTDPARAAYLFARARDPIRPQEV